MSIGLQIPGRLKSQATTAKRRSVADVLGSMGDWFEEAYEPGLILPPALDEQDRQASLAIQLMPGSEPVFFTQAGADIVTVSANTGWGGPGYHKHLCDVLRILSSEFKIEWIESEEENDETGYWSTQDWEELNAQVQDWIQQVCRVVVENSGELGSAETMKIGMSMNMHFNTPGGVQTPLGLHKKEWFVDAAENAEAAMSLLAWTHPDHAAQALRGQVLAAMWQDVGWHLPRTEGEARVHAYVLRALDRARQMDGRIALPQAEWDELKSYTVEEEGGASTLSPLRRAPDGRIGYRRWPVTVHPFAGWHLTLPGGMSEGEEDEGTAFWFEEDRSVHFSTFSVSGPGGSNTAQDVLHNAPPAEGEVVDTWEQEEGVGKLSVADAESDEGEPYVVFTGLVATRSQLGVCTITAGSREEADFAKTVCRSIAGQDQDE